MHPFSHILLLSAACVAATTCLLSAGLVLHKLIAVLRGVCVSRCTAGYRDIVTAIVLQDDMTEADTLKSWTIRHRSVLDGLRDDLKRPWSRSRRLALNEVLAEMSRTVRGETLDRVALLYERCGFVRHALRELRSPRWWVRARACRDLGAMRSRRALFALLECLHDPFEEVRQEASLALVGIVGAGEALGPILREVGEINPWFALRLSVAVNTAAAEALDHLLDALDAPAESVRRFAVVVLGEVKDPAAVPDLLASFAHAPAALRAEIVGTLGKIGDARALPQLLAGTVEPEARVRRASIAALGDLGTPAAAERLVGILRSADLEEGRESARALVRLLEPFPEELRAIMHAADPMMSDVLFEALDEAGVDPFRMAPITKGAA